MNARGKLNVAFVNGSLLLAVVAGVVLNSWIVFFVISHRRDRGGRVFRRHPADAGTEHTPPMESPAMTRGYLRECLRPPGEVRAFLLAHGVP